MAFLIEGNYNSTDSQERAVSAWLLVAAFLILLLVLAPCRALAGFEPEQVRAAYIYNLPNFVNWPNDSSREKRFVIKVLGNRALAHYLGLFIGGERIKGLPAQVVHIESIEQADGCRMLFIDRFHARSIDRARLIELAEKGILTIGESEDFLKKGGIVGLVQIGRRIIIMLNPAVAQRTRITFSSKLMKVAKVYGERRGER